MLIRMFARHEVQRTYVAVVHGHLEAQTIDTWLVRDRGDGLRGSTSLVPEAEGALRAITLDAAHILGIDDRFGSLETGKAADLVLYDGDCFEHVTHVTHTVIGGRVVYDRDARYSLLSLYLVGLVLAATILHHFHFRLTDQGRAQLPDDYEPPLRYGTGIPWKVQA